MPTLVHLDCAFINAAWEVTLFNFTLNSLPKPTSDHVPLPIMASSSAPVSQVFRYGKVWGLNTAFRDLIRDVWERPQNMGGKPVVKLVCCLKWTRVECKKWARSKDRPDSIMAAYDLVIKLLDLLEVL